MFFCVCWGGGGGKEWLAIEKEEKRDMHIDLSLMREPKAFNVSDTVLWTRIQEKTLENK